MGSSQTRDQTCVSCFGPWTLYPFPWWLFDEGVKIKKIRTMGKETVNNMEVARKITELRVSDQVEMNAGSAGERQKRQ